MKKYLKLAAAAALALGGTACSSSSTHHSSRLAAKYPAITAAPSRAAASAPSIAATAAGSPTAATFCNLARMVGKSNLGVSAGNLDPDPKKLLSQVDQLDATAPPELKKDFDVFASFEHTVIDPGNSAPPATVRGDTTAALEHVSSYFANVCHIA